MSDDKKKDLTPEELTARIENRARPAAPSSKAARATRPMTGGSSVGSHPPGL